jgi:hypothetical protein
MANLLQSTQTKTTCVPSFYTQHLTNLATKGQQAADTAKFVGAQPLQVEAFKNATANAGAGQPAFTQGEKLLGCAANVNIQGAASPYLTQAANINTGQLAQCYMSPYINSAVQNMSNIGMRNIQQNLIPQANAAAVGSGQFGSLRGSQVAGQVGANAMQDLNSQIANLENTGYSNALNAAVQKQSLLGQLGSTAATAGAECARAKQAAGVGMGQLGTGLTNANIACENALATLGAQEQTIGQNAQCYEFSKLAKQAGILSGAQIPTTVKTTKEESPYSALGTLGSGALGILQKYPDLASTIGSTIGKLIPDFSSSTGPVGNSTGPADSGALDPNNPNNQDPTGSTTTIPTGGLENPANNGPQVIDTSSDFADLGNARGGLIQARRYGAMGCSSTRHYGGLPRG